MKKFIKNRLRSIGIDVVPYHHTCHEVARRCKLLELLQTDVILDVGANAGQYAAAIRLVYGFSGYMISFEPLSQAFKSLQENLGADRAWRGHNIALGASSSMASINVAANSASSSLLPMLDRHSKAAPDALIVSEERVRVERLDHVDDPYLSTGKQIYLKVDAQGYELEVIHGCGDLMQKISAVQLELSLTPLYEGAPTLPRVIDFMHSRDYQLVAIEPGFSSCKSGVMLQADGIFVRRDRLSDIEEAFR